MANEIKKTLDLHGVACPMNFVKAKLALDELDKGERLQLVLDEGEAMLNVPRSLRDEGHTVVKVDPAGEVFRVTVEKG